VKPATHTQENKHLQFVLCRFQYGKIEKNLKILSVHNATLYELKYFTTDNAYFSMSLHSRRRSNVFEDASFWFLPTSNQILPNFTQFNQICPNLPKKFARRCSRVLSFYTSLRVWL